MSIEGPVVPRQMTGALDANGVGQDANGNIRYDIWAMTDLILYITMDGQMSIYSYLNFIAR